MEISSIFSFTSQDAFYLISASVDISIENNNNFKAHKRNLCIFLKLSPISKGKSYFHPMSLDNAMSFYNYILMYVNFLINLLKFSLKINFHFFSFVSILKSFYIQKGHIFSILISLF